MVDEKQLQDQLELIISTQPKSGAVSPIYGGLSDWVARLAKEWGAAQLLANKARIVNVAMKVVEKFVSDANTRNVISLMLGAMIESIAKALAE